MTFITEAHTETGSVAFKPYMALMVFARYDAKTVKNQTISYHMLGGSVFSVL